MKEFPNCVRAPWRWSIDGVNLTGSRDSQLSMIINSHCFSSMIFFGTATKHETLSMIDQQKTFVHQERHQSQHNVLVSDTKSFVVFLFLHWPLCYNIDVGRLLSASSRFYTTQKATTRPPFAGLLPVGVSFALRPFFGQVNAGWLRQVDVLRWQPGGPGGWWNPLLGKRYLPARLKVYFKNANQAEN